jgi:hypothetical protein
MPCIKRIVATLTAFPSVNVSSVSVPLYKIQHRMLSGISFVPISDVYMVTMLVLLVVGNSLWS